MKKFTKITLWIATILLVTGLGFLIAGSVTAGGMGVLAARLRSGELNFGNWHFEDGVYYKGGEEIDVTNFAKGALNLLPAGNERVADEFEVDITRLEIETDLSNITIKMSETDHLRVSLEDGYTKYYETDVDDNTLTIRYDVNGRTFKQGPKIVVEIPENQQMECIYVNTNLGEVTLLELTQQVEDLEIYSDMGNIRVEDCKMKGNCIISAALGNIAIEDSQFKMVDLSADMGNIDFCGRVEADMTAQADMGNITVELQGFPEDYNIQLSTDMGNVVYAGEKQGSYFDSYNVEADAYIVLNCDMGDVELNFD